MSTYSLTSNASTGAGSNGPSGTATPPVLDQGKALDEALGVVKVQAFHMKRSLDASKLMDALKHASTMLSELRTSSLTPKYYYELYMAIFDELRHLSTFLYDAHMAGRHHLSDMYELVQYAANIVPRLYLMVTVGAVYMRVSRQTLDIKGKGKALDSTPFDAADGGHAHPDVPPIKELMKDMLEMTRGVQHPTRGLFLRYYLCGITRDYLPDVLQDGPHGSIDDSIHFIIHNFIEMNKLWVRLQHQGHSREREKREQERRELRLLVGSNLVRLSQLEELSLGVYQSQILPTLLDEIVSCRDVIAQEYLMEVIIQVFPDDFHLRCLDIFLSATARLQRTVNVKQIVISLIDRFAGYAARAREDAAANSADGKPSLGALDDARLFDVFWTQITELVNARPEFTIQDIVALLVSLSNLSLNCYPDELGYIDRVLGMAREKVAEAAVAEKSGLADSKTRSLLQQLLMGPIQTYHKNVLRILDFPSSSTQTSHSHYQAEGQPPSPSLGGNFTDLLFLQPYATRRHIAHACITNAIRAAVNDAFTVSTIEGVNFLLGEVSTIMVRDQVDGGLFGAKRKPAPSADPLEEPDIPLDWEDAQEEQTYLAKLVHLLRASGDDLHQELLLLTAARNHFGEGGDIRIRFTLPPLVIALIKLARKYYYSHSPLARTDVPLILRTIHQTITSLNRAQEHFTDDDGYKPLFKDDLNASYAPPPRIGHGLMSPPDVSLRLYLLSAQVADEMREEEMCYEFFVQALMVYEESVSESKAQVAAITQIIGTLYGTTVFGYENYETLITKCAVHCSRLLKRVDQCRGVTLVSHLFWADDAVKREEGKPAYRDGKRVLECLQKALKIADSVMDQTVNVELFVEILERYVWYYEQKNDTITIKYLNSLIDLIQTNLSNADSPLHLNLPAVSGGPLSATSQAMSVFHVDHGSSGRFSLGAAGNSSGGGGNGASLVSRKTVSDQAIAHFRNVLLYLEARRDMETQMLDSASVVPGMSAGFAGSGAGGGRWGSIEIPRR
ncbi:vacuolar protein sorting-associated protein 35 [Entophlyctis helioformis]|nr:vacuolar protein sorting-associated protein 35 [Entophlyctis helioformis]